MSDNISLLSEKRQLLLAAQRLVALVSLGGSRLACITISMSDEDGVSRSLSFDAGRLAVDLMDAESYPRLSTLSHHVVG